MEEQLLNVLKYISVFKNLYKEELAKRMVEYSRNERKHLTKNEIIEKGWNIYYKKDFSIYKIINDLEEKKFIRIDDVNKVNITNLGVMFLKSVYTDNYSEEYYNYLKEFNILRDKMQLPEVEEGYIMKSFYNRENILDVLNDLKKGTNHVDIKRILDENNIKFNDNLLLFRLIPTLFVDLEHCKSKVRLEVQVDGNTIDCDTLVVKKPFINKRYYVCYKKKNTTQGFFPIVKNKDDFPCKTYVILKWIIDEEIIIEHQLNIKFKKDSGYGNVFSNNEMFYYPSAIKKNNIVTSLENKNENRNMKIIHKEYNYYLIKENVELSKYPLEYQDWG